MFDRRDSARAGGGGGGGACREGSGGGSSGGQLEFGTQRRQWWTMVVATVTVTVAEAMAAAGLILLLCRGTIPVGGPWCESYLEEHVFARIRGGEGAHLLSLSPRWDGRNKRPLNTRTRVLSQLNSTHLPDAWMLGRVGRLGGGGVQLNTLSRCVVLGSGAGGGA